LSERSETGRKKIVVVVYDSKLFRRFESLLERFVLLNRNVFESPWRRQQCLARR